MSIASEIQALQQDKDDITNALINKRIVVPSGSGFDDFAGLIGGIDLGVKMSYQEQWVQAPTTELTFSFDFEPKAVIFSCRANESTIDSYLPTASSGKTMHSLYSFFEIPTAFSGGALPLVNFVSYTAGDATTPQITLNSPMRFFTTITYNSSTNKWDMLVKFKSTSSAFEYGMAGTTQSLVVETTGVPYNVVVWG